MKVLIAFLIASAAGVFAPASALAAKATKTRATTPDWTVLAPKVGMSEEYRDRALKEIKRIPNLKGKLRAALKTAKRPLALEAIGALEMTSLVPDMVKLLPTDKDGFLTLAVNAMMTPGNQDKILNRYLELLPKASVPAQVAMLEPLGRLNVEIPRTSLEALAAADSPDVRAGVLYYVRIMGLRHRSFDHIDLVREITHAREMQVRLQAESILRELTPRERATHVEIAGP